MKNQKISTKFITLLLVAGVLLAIWTSRGEAVETQEFSNARLRGTYAGLNRGLEGFDIPGGPFEYAGLVVATFDGMGNLSGRQTASVNGTIINVEGTGTYQVNPDGTGSVTINIPGLPDVHANLVILDSGREIATIETNSGAVVVGTLKKQ